MSIQARIARWVNETLGPEGQSAGLSPLENKQERCVRFVEEAIELAQAVGVTRAQLHSLVDYVMGRPVGEVHQEIGGSMLTLYAASEACGVDADAQALKEIERVETPEIRDKVRRRQVEKREALGQSPKRPDLEVELTAAASVLVPLAQNHGIDFLIALRPPHTGRVISVTTLDHQGKIEIGQALARDDGVIIKQTDVGGSLMPRRCVPLIIDGVRVGSMTVQVGYCSSTHCNGVEAKRCDYPVMRKGKPGTCDRKLCSKCAVQVGPDKDFCPAHARAGAPEQGELF